MNSNTCPCCGHRLQATKSPNDKKLIQDLAKAQFAIEVLLRAVGDLTNGEPLRHACAEEITRLTSAVNGDYGLLWHIYRRRDKSAGYVSSLQLAA